MAKTQSQESGGHKGKVKKEKNTKSSGEEETNVKPQPLPFFLHANIIRVETYRITYAGHDQTINIMTYLFKTYPHLAQLHVFLICTLHVHVCPKVPP